jgi:2-aminoethylphosphonate-pyruvate transaminase
MKLFRRLASARGSVPCRALADVARREPLLFTPGPLTTSDSTKQAMLVDLGSRDGGMVHAVRDIREKLLAMAHVSQAAGYECVLMQGSGTFTVEAVLGSVIPPPSAGGRLLVLSNGAYGERMATMAQRLGIAVDVARFGETDPVDPAKAADALRAGGGGGGAFTHVAVVHHETTAGVLNDIDAIGAAVRAHAPSAAYVVDAMSSFGAYDVDLAASGVHYLVSSANKLIEGVPGFAFALCDRARLEAEGGHARSLALDLRAQWRGLEANGQFRFTPPTHALLAFRQALQEHADEGGVGARRARYEANCAVLTAGMAELGFAPYVADAHRGAIISTFLFPDDARFDFARFYAALADRGFVIYPGKLTEADCFRIGSIGRLFPSDMRNLLAAVRDALAEMGVATPVSLRMPAAVP